MATTTIHTFHRPKFPTDLHRCVAIDVEATGLEIRRSDRMFAAAAVFPDGRQLYWREDFRALHDILRDETLIKVFQNAKYDLLALEKEGLQLRGEIRDTMIYGHLLDGRRAAGELNLGSLAMSYLPTEYRKVVDEVEAWFKSRGFDPKSGYDFSLMPDELNRKRCVGDAVITLKLLQRLAPTVEKVFPFLVEQEHRLLPVVKKMEDRGIVIDIEQTHAQIHNFEIIVEDCIDWLADYMGWTWFNLNSPAHQKALIEKAGLLDEMKRMTAELPAKKRPKSGIKLDDYHLRQVRHPATHHLILGKAAAKMGSTFLSGMLDRQIDGVLHASFNQLGTTTGRFSCSNPNLQNIPIDGDRRTSYTEEEASDSFEMTGVEYAPHIKRIFRTRDGYAHIHSDKKQAEMVMLGHYTRDPNMLKIFATGESIHDGICKLLYNQWTKGLKTRTKAVVFGFQYGAGDPVMARKMGEGATIEDARRMKRRLGEVMPSLPRWQRKLASEISDRGYVQTIHGRRHYLGSFESYKSVNRMCQGSVGDEIKSRMVALDDFYTAERLEAQVLLNIHDDIASECHDDDVPRCVPRLFELMNDTSMEYALALPADCSITYTHWADLMDIKDELIAHPDEYSRERHAAYVLSKQSKQRK